MFRINSCLITLASIRIGRDPQSFPSLSFARPTGYNIRYIRFKTYTTRSSALQKFGLHLSPLIIDAIFIVFFFFNCGRDYSPCEYQCIPNEQLKTCTLKFSLWAKQASLKKREREQFFLKVFLNRLKSYCLQQLQ